MRIRSLALNIITHNGASACLRETLKSVQHYTEEIWVTNDGSTDDTARLLREEFPGVGVVHYLQSHTDGRAVMLNELKRKTKSAWILRLDDDEVMPRTTMEEVFSIMPDVPVYTIPFLHYEDGYFIDPKAHKKSSFYVARLFRNNKKINWVNVQEVLSYRGRLISSRGNQMNLCRKMRNPFLHFGELKPGRAGTYTFHERGHCALPLGDYAKYVPTKD